MSKINLEKSNTIYRELHGEIDRIESAFQSQLVVSDTPTKMLFDFSGGPCVTSLGHSNDELKDSIRQQLLEVPYVYSGFWGTHASEELGDLLKEEFEATWPGWFGKAAFACSGNEGVEFALRIAAQYWLERGEDKHMFGVRKSSFHGVSLLTSAITDDYGRYTLMTPFYKKARKGYVVRLPGYSRFDVSKFSEETIIKSTELLIEKHKKDLAAVIIETVGGPPVGAYPPSRKYLASLRKACNKHKVLLIFDEVLCGSGRVGAFTAGQLFDVQPDIVVLGKGITSGYVPLSAVVVSSKIINTISKKSGVMMVGTTYFDHPTLCACAVATLKYLKKHRLIEKVSREGFNLQIVLEQELSSIPIVKNVTGKGFLIGIELTKPDGKFFAPELQVHKMVRSALYDAGIVTYSKGQTINGKGDFVILAPPFTTEYAFLLEKAREMAYPIAEVAMRLGY